MTQAFILVGLFTFLALGWWLGRDFGRTEASLEWIPRMKNAREVHMTDVFNMASLSLLKGPAAAGDYAAQALDRIPTDIRALQAVPPKEPDGRS